jgi:asparagine synthase (glutamine-hydrolysing)
LVYARAAAARYGTQHTDLSDDGRDLADLLWEMQRVYDEPFGDSSNIPTYLIAQEARKHITVVLTGDGGDELLAGYTDWYQPLLRLDDARTGASAVRRALARSLRLAQRVGLPLEIPPDMRHELRSARLAGRYPSSLAAHVASHRYFTDTELARMGLRAPGALPSGDFEDVLRWDVEHYMAGDILVKTDRAAMAHGLELRAPFLDVEFATFCLTLPARLKLARGSDKLILRAAFSDIWPPAVRSRRKAGFGAPVAHWLATPSLDHLVKEYVLNPARKVYQLLDYSACRSIVRRRSYQEWNLLVLSLWLETHDFQWQQT